MSQKQKDFPLTEMPKGRLFQPNEKLVEQLEKKDYLGKATVCLLPFTLFKLCN